MLWHKFSFSWLILIARFKFALNTSKRGFLIWIIQEIRVKRQLLDILLVLIAIGIPIAAHVYFDKGEDSQDWIVVTAGILLNFLLISVWRVFQRYKEVETYAKHCIEARSYSQAIQFIASRIWLEIECLNIYSDFFATFNISSNGYLKSITNNQKRIIKQLKSVENGRNYRVRRIHHMMVALGADMRIPAYRLSDYLFQFSPDIFSEELRQTLKALNEIEGILEGNAITISDQRDRIKGLSDKVYSFYNRTSKRLGYMESLCKFHDLHDFLIEVSGDFGMTKSLYAYARGLQEIAGKWSDLTSQEKKDLEVKRAKFLYHKRRLCPGFDLHAVLLNFSKIPRTTKATDNVEEALKKLANCRCSAKRSTSTNLYDVQEDVMPGLIKVANYLTDYVYIQRKKIKQQLFDHLYEQIQAKPKVQQIVLVTQGFSSVVNDAMISLANDEFTIETVDGKEKSHRIWEHFPDFSFHYFVLFSPEKMDTANLSTTRYIRYKFKENPNIPLKTGGRIKVRMGDHHWLQESFDLIDSQDTTIAVALSGAEFIQRKECYDDDGSNSRMKLRLINTEGTYKLEENHLIGEHMPHLILAEPFKVFDWELSDPIVEQAFSRDLLEHAHLYSKSEFRILLDGEKD